MAKYARFLYGKDTYGDRVRRDIQVKILNVGSWQGPNDRMYARFRMTVGPFPSDYPEGSRVVILRGSTWYPEIPPKLGSTEQSIWLDPSEVTYEPYVNDNPVVLYSNIVGEDGILPGGSRVITEQDTAPVPINSVLYVRVVVQEPPVLLNPDVPDDGYLILPWDTRGVGWAVMAGNYGGTETAIQTLPATYYTDGDPFGVYDNTSTTARFMSSLGFLSDIISTDGALMVDDPSRMHPGLVNPLLRSYGMTIAERSVFSDDLLLAKTKNLLFAYKNMQASRGSSSALHQLSATVTGYDISVLTHMDNLLAALGDASPAGGVEYSVYGWAVGCGFEVRNTHHSAVYAGSFNETAQLPPPWGDLWIGWLTTDYWGVPGDEHWTNIWGACWTDTVWEDPEGYLDPWLDRWDQLDLPTNPAVVGTAYRPSRPIEDQYDTWYGEDGYDQHVDWVHAVTVANGKTGYIGTKSDRDGVPLREFSQPLPIFGEQYRLRCRAITEDPEILASIQLEMFFLDADGAVVLQHTEAPTLITAIGAWTDFQTLVVAPDDSEYVAWRISTTTDEPGVVFIGAVELRGMELYVDPITHALTTPSENKYLWDRPYRNPRSCVVAVHSPWVDNVVRTLTVDDEGVLVDDTEVLVDGKVLEATQGAEAADRLVIDKLRQLIPDFLPYSVSARLIAGWDYEYQARFPERGPISNTFSTEFSEEFL